MSLINENPRISDFLLYQAAEEINYIYDQITLANGSAASQVGTVLGKQTLGAATKAAKSGGNTGAGTLVLDVTTPVLANAKAGIYTVRVVAVGTFIVVDPYGVSIGEGIYGAGGSVTFADQVKFAFTDDGTTHYIVGDGFDITIAAGSGKFVPLALTALDGTQIAAGVLLAPVPVALTADATSVAATRGPAVLKSSGLLWPSGATAPQIATGTAQLLALGMTTRAGYGV